MEYTNETIIFSLVYIVCMNWMYIREYKTPKDIKRKGVIRRGTEWD